LAAALLSCFSSTIALLPRLCPSAAAPQVLSEELMRVSGEKSEKEFEFDRVFAPTGN
jgi:hypothetical protein